MPEFINLTKLYNSKFDEKLTLIVGDQTSKWFPEKAFGGSGVGDRADKGIIQFYVQGFPYPPLVWRFWKQILNESERKDHQHTLDDFRLALLDVLDQVDKIVQKKLTAVALFDTKHDSTAPKQAERFQTKKYYNSVNRISEQEDQLDVEAEYDRMQTPEYYYDSDTAEEEAASESKEELVQEESKEVHEEEDLREEDDWILAVFVDPKQPENKKTLPCFKLAKTGTCAYGDKCQYSHEGEVIKKYLAVKDLGRDTIQKLNTPRSILKRGQEYKPYTKPTTGLNKGPGDGRRVA
jgi:hypothetical protein